jgi:nitroimidazol reductase NimA-like FMN-containing flavoprotein (pyridoxamine 5'-phosphate oxidase superfamily)/predicted enzyme related to lactoylglutathione lyase
MAPSDSDAPTVRQLRIVVKVEDYDASVTFLRDVLGLTEEAAFSGGGGAEVTILDAGRATLELANPAHHRYVDEVEVGLPVAPRYRLAFEVDDAEAVTERLIARGGVQVAPPTRTPWDSLNARLDVPGNLHITVFQELVGLPVAEGATPDRAEPDPYLQAMVREVIDGNRYITLGTVEPGGQPRLSPVYFTHDGYRTFYWVSGHETHHSRNLGRRPAVSMVIYDSGAAPGDTRAVYVDAVAQEVPDDELAEACAVAFRSVGGGARPFTPDELSAAAPLRLYRAEATSHAVHIRGSDPRYGTGVDARVPVAMP